MKCVILLFVLFFELNVFAQSESSRWNLNQNMWSHAQNFQKPVQKPVIDTSVIGKWPEVGEAKISNNGKYLLYSIRNQPLHSNTLIIESVNDSWKKEFPGLQSAIFSDDSRKAFYIQGKDSLCMLHLGSDSPNYMGCATSFQLFKQAKDEWVAYQADSEKTLVLKNGKTGQKRIFKNVTEYLISKNGKSVIYITEPDSRITKSQSILWINLSRNPSDKPTILWKGNEAHGLMMDNTDTQLAFMVNSVNNASKEIWYYNNKNGNAEKIADDHSPGIEDNLKLESISNFGVDAKTISIRLKEKDYPIPNADGVKVDVWNYRDARLQSQQLAEDVPGYGQYIGPRTYAAIIDIPRRRVIRLQNEYEKLQIINDSLGLIVYCEGNEGEKSWNMLAQPKYYLVSLITGERQIVDIPFSQISTSGRYLLGRDTQYNWFSYNQETGMRVNLTKFIPISLEEREDQRNPRSHNVGLLYSGLWLPNDIMLMHDKYDIWQIDASGLKPPVNLTNGYGRKNKITFRLINYGSDLIRNNDILLLDAFNHRNKDNGFYQMVAGKEEDPTPLIMGPYVFSGGDNLSIGGELPIKARDAKAYIVMRNSAGKSPNYFWTNNLKIFKAVSDVYPETRYNWLISELKEFETLDGRTEQGILYKPQNFDSTKKYPVIIHYYEEKSHQLNQYFLPDFSDGDINIPYFVSRGYLVFVPDIHYANGEIGQGASNSIIAAGKFLSGFSFVDSKKMALSGHSFGGFETIYVITQSNLFAAAFSDAGVTNFVSQYGSYELNSGRSLQAINERGQNRMGANLWQKPNVYLKNSPIFYADKVNTPLLIVSNKKDAIVHFEQGLQFFLALRRLAKPTWMLQYDGEQHTVGQEKNRADLTIRMTQFFDHYLKDAPCPSWMIKGIRARDKGIETGYELDTTGRTPGAGLLIVPCEK